VNMGQGPKKQKTVEAAESTGRGGTIPPNRLGNKTHMERKKKRLRKFQSQLSVKPKKDLFHSCCTRARTIWGWENTWQKIGSRIVDSP